MTLSYLYQPGSGILNVSGFCNVLFRPDVGQYWLPIWAHSGTTSQNPLRCTIYAGGVAQINPAVPNGTPPDLTAAVDTTLLGGNDVSTILSGRVIAPGEGILFRYNGGIPGEVVAPILVGLSSDEPPTRGVIPNIPGVRFAGANAVPVDPHPVLYNAPTGTFTSTITSAVIPVQLYNHINIFAQIFNSSSPIRITLSWYTTGAATTLITADIIDMLTNGTSGQLFNQSVAVRGPYLQVTISLPSAGTGNLSALNVQGAPVPSIGQTTTIDNQIFLIPGSSVAATTTTTFQQNIRQIVGPASITMYSPDATIWDMTLSCNQANGTSSNIARASAGFPALNGMIFLPSGELSIAAHNGDASARTFWAFIMAKPLYP